MGRKDNYGITHLVSFLQLGIIPHFVLIEACWHWLDLLSLEFDDFCQKPKHGFRYNLQHLGNTLLVSTLRLEGAVWLAMAEYSV